VNKRQLGLTLGVIITSFIIILFSSCTKINEATELGAGLIPAVDNISTFDTTLEVQAYNDIFTLATDSQRLAATEEHFLGVINTDPVFGKTDARIFLELKPAFYPFFFPRKDSLEADSIVLILNYVESYGDTDLAQTVNVYEMDQTNKFNSDSVYLIRKNDFTYSNQLGFKTFLPRNLKDSVKAFQDTTSHQLRIPLDINFARRLLAYDSTRPAGAYSSDSAFRTFFKGFALQSVNAGKAVMGFNFTGAKTKLAIYYRQPKKTGTLDSATVTNFNFTNLSASANYVQRDYSGTPVLASVGGSSPDPFVYLQNSPGSFAAIKIPALTGLNNRVIHRAELIMEQVYTDINDSIFRAPDYLYLDAFDPTITTTPQYRTIPYDIIYDASGGLNLGSFGVAPFNAVDGSGNLIKTWRFNISRYVQHVVTKTQSAFDLRLYAPSIVVNQYRVPTTTVDIKRTLSINQTIVKGRIKLTGSKGPLDPDPHRMRLHIIYSKL